MCMHRYCNAYSFYYGDVKATKQDRRDNQKTTRKEEEEKKKKER